MDTLTLINSIGTVAIAIGIFGFSKILPKYFEKKGENLALRQDIQVLTKLVKDVEHSFTEKTEKLKYQLDLSKQLYVGLHNEERSTIIQLHLSLRLLMSNIDLAALYELKKFDNSELKKYNALLTKNFSDLNRNYSNIILFVEEYNDHEIKKGYNDLFQKIMFYRYSPTQNCISKLISINDAGTLGGTIKLTTIEKMKDEIMLEYTNITFKYVYELEQKINAFTELLKKYLSQKIKEPS